MLSAPYVVVLHGSNSAGRQHDLEATEDQHEGEEDRPNDDEEGQVLHRAERGQQDSDDSDDSDDDSDAGLGNRASAGNLSPRTSTRLHRAKWLGRCIWFSRELRTFVIIALIVYTLYLQVTASQSKNWETSRLIGFVQPGVCVDAANRYGVKEYDVQFYPADDDRNQNSNYETWRPLAYRDGSPDMPCFDAATLSKCSPILQNIDTGESMYEFKSFFKRDPKHNYFPYSTFIDILAFICLLLSVLYEGPDESFHFIQYGEFASSVDRSLVRRANHIITMILIIIVFVAASKQHFLYEEDCDKIYRDDETKSNFCKYLESCGMSLASVIRPEDFSIREYKSTMITFGTFLILAAISRCFVPKSYLLRIIPSQRRPNRLGRNRINRINQELARLQEDEWFGDHLQLNDPMALLSNLVFNGETPRGRIVPLAIAEERKANWKVIQKKDLSSLDEECPICLQYLNSAFSQKFSTKSLPSEEGHDPAVTAAIEGTTPENPEQQPPGELSPPLQEEVVRIGCEHIFHTRCIENWMLDHNTCPVCRKSV